MSKEESQAEAGDARVQRGDSWRHDAERLRSATRHAGYLFSSYCYVGFRVARRLN